ncbi:MAG: NACHT domain-containing protein [Leptolyngbya sp. SIO4C1]|nr:NACHT domain-containing protein [Leptolyngbya sp. SIO4C1]
MSSAESPSSDPHSPSPAERRYVQKIVQALVQLAPLGSSGGLLIHFLLQQAWIEAVLIFPVTMVSVIWAAYTESFIARLREIFSERGRQDADSLMRWLSQLNQGLRWQISGYETLYLTCQANACRDYVTEGLRKTEGIFIPMLEEVFVPLEMGDAALEPARSHPEPAAAAQTSLSIWDFLSRVRQVPTYRRMAILAWGGYGKTTLLRHLTFSYATQQIAHPQAPKLVPVLLYLRKWQDLIAQKDPPDLPTLIARHYVPELPEGKQLSLPPAWADNLLKRGDGLVMIDGFDEVAEPLRAAVSHWISQEMAEYPKSVFIVTSRPAGYQGYVAEKPQATLYVKAFNSVQQAQFIQRWYRCQERLARGGRDTSDVREIAQREAADLIAQIQQRPELETMAQNPLRLNMIAMFHRFYPGSQLPQQRSTLYQDICQMQLWDRPLAKRIAMLLSAAESQAVLQGIALEMVERDRTSLPLPQLTELAAVYLARVSEEAISPAEFIAQMATVSELLVEREPQQYEFAHLSLQSYLAAAQIRQLAQGEARLLHNWHNAWWRETILLYATQVNPAQLIASACDRSLEATPLAYACLLETPRQIPADIFERLQTLRYQPLEALLRQGQWRDADAETYRLMLETVGKEPGQLLTPDELLGFPCDDYARLNQLWLRYSNGRFGFSVQKELYLASGGLLDDKYHEDAWKQLCDRIGWMSDGEYVLVDFIFSLKDAPVGHLPLGLLRIWFRWCAAGDIAGDGWGLFSRIENCEL